MEDRANPEDQVLEGHSLSLEKKVDRVQAGLYNRLLLLPRTQRQLRLKMPVAS